MKSKPDTHVGDLFALNMSKQRSVQSLSEMPNSMIILLAVETPISGSLYRSLFL